MKVVDDKDNKTTFKINFNPKGLVLRCSNSSHAKTKSQRRQQIGGGFKTKENNFHPHHHHHREENKLKDETNGWL